MNPKFFSAVTAINLVVICGLSAALIKSLKVKTPTLVFDPCWDIRNNEMHIFVAMRYSSHEEVVKFRCDAKGVGYAEGRWNDGVQRYFEAGTLRQVDTLKFEIGIDPTPIYDPSQRHLNEEWRHRIEEKAIKGRR